MIPLVCGDPEREPASYTRFVLPFAYSPTPYDRGNAPRVYKPAEAVSLWRKKYVTVETAAVLFKRARWFDLKGLTLASFPIQHGGRSISVGMKPPRLVLFEWTLPPGRTPQTQPNDLLRLGFLIVETYFPEKINPASLDDLLAFNELFRYWQCPYDGHAEQTYKSLLAQCLVDMVNPGIRIGDETTSAIYTKRWTSFLQFPIEDDNGTLWRLMPVKWEQDAEMWMTDPSKIWQSGWIVYTDNRAFVWTCAILKEGGKTLANYFNVSMSPLEASVFGHWVKLLNVDGPSDTPEKTHETLTTFERTWAAERTYCRWQEHGTFYGFNYHCGAMLGPPLRAPKDPPLWKHFGEMYFDQTLLLLYLRVGSFRFSRQLSSLSAQARDNADLDTRKGFETWRRAFEKLRGDFALFTNLYQFPLLSNQQQGVEMYNLARCHLDVEALFREIQEEIRSSHEYLELRAGQEQTRTSTQLTVVATVGLMAGLASSLLGMNVVVDLIKGKTLGSQFGIAVIFFSLCVYGVLKCVKRVESILDYFERIRKRCVTEIPNLKKPPQ